jgi:hypothetical protein
MNSKQYAQINRSTGQSVSDIAAGLGEKYEIASLADDYEEVKLYRAICGVVAKVLVLPPECYIVINKMPTRVSDVQSIYRKLTSDEIEWVAKKYRTQKDRLQNPHEWMRTTLYNSPEDMELDLLNQVMTDFGG